MVHGTIAAVSSGTQVILGAGAIASGIILPQACISSAKPEGSGILSPDDLCVQYQNCLGGPFPDTGPLNTEIRETIQKDGYRIESLTYEVLPGERIPALLLVPG